MRTRRKLWMSCTLSCILAAEYARTSQFEPAVAQTNLKKTRRTAKVKRFQDRRFQPLTYSSVSNSSVLCELAANLQTLRHPLHRQFLALFRAVKKITVD
jgi:hypothetical protein